MADPFDHQKKRPPPIQIPPLPRHVLGHPSHTTISGHPQQQQPGTKNASSFTQQGSRSATTPFTSPLEHDGSCLPHSGSQKSRASAMMTLTGLMEQARASPHKAEQGSTMARSTTRSGHSERSRHSAIIVQAELEALDPNESTSRGKIELRTEKNLFKMTGQVPPTPIADSAGKNEVIISRQDLREKCQAISREKKTEHQEPAKSPKKKIFGMHLPTFGRSSTPTPPMPSKAAQVLGQEPRNPRKIVVQPIKPAVPYKTPTKTLRSDTVNALPAKLLNQGNYTHSHHNGATRHSRTASRRSPSRGSKQSSDAENTPPIPALNSSFELSSPPTPPAKDTPPDGRIILQPTSPLRRAAPSDRLRESYSANVNTRLQFPTFALSPLPSKALSTENAGKSPTKYLPCSADEYQQLLAGEALPWASLAKDNSNHKKNEFGGTQIAGNCEESLLVTFPDRRGEEKHYKEDGKPEESQSAPLVRRQLDPLQLPRPDRWSEGQQSICGNHDNRHYSPLQPRFYSPSNRSVQMFAEGETPSKNSDTSRLLCTVVSRADLFQPREDSMSGSIEIIFQGDVNDIDSRSSTSDLMKSSNQETMRDDSRLAARVMQELRVNEQEEKAPSQNGGTGHLRPDQSCSRLTDMLQGVSPLRGDFDGDFQPNCLSAVPSPLHKMPGQITSMQPMPVARDPAGPFGHLLTPKTIEDHFYMTNEHLDVVGKSTWDQIETLKKEHCDTLNHKHSQLVNTVKNHVQEIKMQVDSVNEKADRTTEQGHNIQTKLDQLFDSIKDEVMGALVAQDTKMTGVEQSVKELQKMVQNMQKMLEQKQSETTVGQQHTTAVSVPTPNSATSPFSLPVHRSQPSLVGYYGNMTESGRESQPSMPHIQDHHSNGLAQDGHSDPRVGYGINYGQQWGPRVGYHGRNSKEERPYSGAHPYHFGNNVVSGSGQFSNGYSGGYSAYSQGEQQYGFSQGQAK